MPAAGTGRRCAECLNASTVLRVLAELGARTRMNLAHDPCPCLEAAINAGMISRARKSGQLRTGT